MASLLAKDNGLSLSNTDDALAVIFSGLPACIFTADELPDGFFDFKNGIAGELLQKFSNYRFKVAIVLAEEHDYGSRATELFHDHRQHPWVRFFYAHQPAQAWLADVV